MVLVGVQLGCSSHSCSSGLMFWLAGLCISGPATRCVLLLLPCSVLVLKLMFILIVSGGFPISISCFGEIFMCTGVDSGLLSVCISCGAAVIVLTGLYL